jgi:hypothetical protein
VIPNPKSELRRFAGERYQLILTRGKNGKGLRHDGARSLPVGR